MSFLSNIAKAINAAMNETAVARNGKQSVVDARGGNDRIHIHTNFDGSVDVDVNGKNYRFSAAEAKNLVIRGGSGDDRITSSGWSNNGTPNITIEGGNGNDVIYGTGGNDHIDGGRGNDVIHGGAGHDMINGGLGDDRIYGDAGNDQITGGGGNDVADGGPGFDRIQDARDISRFPIPDCCIESPVFAPPPFGKPAPLPPGYGLCPLPPGDDVVRPQPFPLPGIPIPPQNPCPRDVIPARSLPAEG